MEEEKKTKTRKSVTFQDLWKDIFAPNASNSDESSDSDENSDSDWSTTESGVSNSFLDEVLNGNYEGWQREHEGLVGRWVSVEELETLLGKLDDVVPNSQTVSAEVRQKMKEFLNKVPLDVVEQDTRFPIRGKFCFIDGSEWTSVICELFDCLNHADSSGAQNWQATLDKAHDLLHQAFTRASFEETHKLKWAEPIAHSSMSFRDIFRSSATWGDEGSGEDESRS